LEEEDIENIKKKQKNKKEEVTWRIKWKISKRD